MTPSFGNFFTQSSFLRSFALSRGLIPLFLSGGSILQSVIEHNIQKIQQTTFPSASQVLSLNTADFTSRMSIIHHNT